MSGLLLEGDNLPHLRGLAADSIDAVVVDVPYGLGKTPTPQQILAYLGGADLVTGDFMGKQWDIPSVAVWREVFRVLKPGRLCLSFAGTRTADLIGMGMRMAGFVPVDSIMAPCLAWVQGQGMNKSRMLLKPAWEPILMMRKPGGKLRELGIEACRVATTDNLNGGAYVGAGPRNTLFGMGRAEGRDFMQPSGRYPPNLLLLHSPWCVPAGTRRVRSAGWRDTDTSHEIGYGGGTPGAGRHYADADGTEEVAAFTCFPGCPVAALDAQAGRRKSGGYPAEGGQRSHGAAYGVPSARGEQRFTASEGAASRFFPTFAWGPDDLLPLYYTAKAASSEKNKGCHGLPLGEAPATARSNPAPGRTAALGRPRPNHHVSVKPLALMRWLVRLTSQPGETVLDCYLGSGTTAAACEQEGRSWVGIERDPEYVAICKARIAAWRKKQLDLFGAA